jgi:hypothetical protein
MTNGKSFSLQGYPNSRKAQEDLRNDDETDEQQLDRLSNLSGEFFFLERLFSCVIDNELCTCLFLVVDHEHNGLDQYHSFLIDDDNFSAHIDHTLINALSASRQKFPTSKKTK